MISCTNIKDNICAYIDNELDINERLSFEEHIRNCSDCKKELDEMSRIVAMCTSLPQQELPADFGAELHEKLLAVAQRQENNETGKSIPKGFRFLKYFAPVAAALLLIFLVGNYYRFGIFSSMKVGRSSNNVSMASEKLQAAPEAAGGQEGVNNDAGDFSGNADQMIRGFGATNTDGESTETHRSVGSERFFAAQENTSEAETVSRRVSTITVTVNEPDTQIERIKELALDNNAEPGTIEVTVADSGNEAYTADVEVKEIEAPEASLALRDSRQQLNYIIPVTNYEQFVSELSNTFGPANIQQGAFVTEDLTEVLNKSITESNELDMKIREIQANGDEKSEELEKIKEKKESTDNTIEKIRLGSDFVNITIYIDIRQ